jgi:hypothetical protein
VVWGTGRRCEFGKERGRWDGREVYRARRARIGKGGQEQGRSGEEKREGDGKVTEDEPGGRLDYGSGYGSYSVGRTAKRMRVVLVLD